MAEGRNYARLAVDLAWVVLSAFVALFIRDNFDPSPARIYGVLPYVALCLLSAIVVFTATRLNRTLWRYVSLIDIVHVAAAVTVALLVALLGAFILNRLEGVPRAVPVIQWMVLISAMVGSRIAFRLWGERDSRKREKWLEIGAPTHQLIVGVSAITELYLRSVSEFAPKNGVIAGVLSQERQLRGRFLHGHKVLGAPENIEQILADLEIHGTVIDRIVVTNSFDQLSREAWEALRAIERSSAIEVLWLTERLGLRQKVATDRQDALKPAPDSNRSEPVSSVNPRYHRIKRAIDAAAALAMLVVLAPLLALVALIVALDVGFPILFWQRRPGRLGYPFKLFKFRTMRAGHDAQGNRISDELRSSKVGRFLRRSWLDELPQLYNILVGEMSSVGPRPLLPNDQPRVQTARLLVRPGLTGWAQIHAGRDISPEKKAALDVWYVSNASLWLDIKILLRTVSIAVSGGQRLAPQAPYGEVKGTRTTVATKSEPTLLTDLG